MESIKDIFDGNKVDEKENAIKTVTVNLKKHKRGIMNIAENLEPKFKLDKNLQDVMLKMLLYFTGSPLSKLDLNKGILLIGGVGTGKSLLFRIYHAYVRDILMNNSFSSETAIDIIDGVNMKGVVYLEQFGRNVIGNKAYPKTLYIDDIASKNEIVSHFGTKLNAIGQLLSMRYNVFTRYGVLTHATSNKYPLEMAEIYDNHDNNKRIMDRMTEMFNIVELDGKSHRK